MKKYIQKALIGFIALFLVVGMTSCEEWLDLKPESEIILDEYWQTESDVEAVLAACYRGLTESDVVSKMVVWGELRSDNFVRGLNPNLDMQKILDGDITASNSYATWGSFYTVINYCNNLLNYAPYVIERDINFSEADLNRVRSEVYALRAMTYFYLVRAFRDVPLVLDASIDDSQDYNIPKSTESVVLDQIVTDLLEARKYARTDFGNLAYNKGRITLDAVNALLADVYLWKGDYQMAVDACDRVLANNNLKLVPASLMLTQVFYLGNSTESIFELQFNENVQINTPVRELFGSASVPQGDLAFPTTLAYDIENDKIGTYSPFYYQVSTTVRESENDIRAKDFYYLYSGQYFVFKYAGVARQETVSGISQYRYRNNTANWIIYRLSDVILMKAEALVQISKNNANSEPELKEAIELVNQTYLRSNSSLGADSLKLQNYANISDVEHLVLRERQRELMFEGKRWFDLVRWARREGSTGTLNTFLLYKEPGSTSSSGAPVLDAMYMPISRRELEANKSLIQNPYYKESGSSSER